MASNNISRIQGTSDTFEFDLTDTDGNRLHAERLKGATAEFLLKVQPTDVSPLLDFTTADPAHLILDPLRSRLILNILPADDGSFALRTYVYQVTFTLADGHVFTPVPWSLYDLNLGGVAATPLPPFDNTVAVNQDFGQVDALRYMAPDGTPIPDAQIRIYKKPDFDQGKLDTPVGVTLTDAFGRWVNPILLTPGAAYVVQFFLPNSFGPDATTIYV